jgi:hypothetical protein
MGARVGADLWLDRRMMLDRLGTRSPVVALAVLMVVVVVGCSAQDGAVGSPGSYLSPYQAAILQDGLVTFDEMDAAVHEYAACVGSATGVEVDVSFSMKSRAFSYLFVDPLGRDAESLVNSPEGEACSQEFKSFVELAWADQEGGSEIDDQTFYAAVADCMRIKGFNVQGSDAATLDYWIDQEPDAYEDCWNTVAFSESGS